MELCSIASGSSGNCIYVGTQDCHLLIDAGISGKKIENGLNRIGLKTSELDGILITHEHTDHIAGLGVVARKYGIPMYGTEETIEAILHTPSVGRIEEELFHPILPEQTFSLSDLTVLPFPVSHDAANPVAYVLEQGGKKAAVATDLGKYDESVIDRLQGLDVLLLEANHDVRMLEAGRYPYPLKRRILGERGHLSNEASGKLLGKVLHGGMKKILLGHLSKENNYAELAYETVRQEVTTGDNPYDGKDLPLAVAGRDTVSERICI